jgi:apolipoprotein D and lipocalin family protein
VSLARHFCHLLMSIVVIAGLAACASAPLVVDEGSTLDLHRLMGTWYVIGHVPYFTERGQVAARDEYALLPDGRIAVHYVYRNGFHAPVKALDAIATVAPDSGNREWHMRFFRVVRAKQRILEVAPDDAWALVTTPDRDLAWVFARTPQMEGKTYQELLRKLRHYGVDSDKVWRVPQTPEQVGGLGFERPNDEDDAPRDAAEPSHLSNRLRPVLHRLRRGRSR